MTYFSFETRNLRYDLIDNNQDTEPVKAIAVYDPEKEETLGFYKIDELVEEALIQSTL